ncbi:MAG: hypothetical protein QOI25_51 [Mycobacterium sp.]|jgi:hypothetical protein|nr:hypothetical protein [Mycobacterium sp.]
MITRRGAQQTHESNPHSGQMNTWSVRGTAVAVGVAAVIAGVGGAAVYAATDSGPRMTGTHSGPGLGQGDRLGGPPHDAIARTAAPDSATLHGEFVVADGTGTFRTVISQTGRVTAISTTSVTARSDDGYSQTYVIPAAAATPPFAVGDPVTIQATRTGQTATVTSMGEPSVAGHRGQSGPPTGAN